MKKKVLNVLLALVVLCSCPGFSDPIGFNISDGSAIPSMEGKTADGCSAWTDGTAASGTGLVMNETGGLVTVSWSASNLWYHGPYGASEEQLYRHYLDDGNPVVVSFDGLENWLTASGYAGAYTIRIYQNTDWGDNTFPVIDITDGVDILETVQAPTANYDRSNGARAFVDSGLLTADSVVLALRERNLGARQRSTFSAAKITLIDKFFPVNPVPAVGDDVPTSQILSWEKLPLANGSGVSYNVYFGTDPNELSPAYYGLAPVKTTTDNPADFFYAPVLENSETYYWRVDAIDPNDGTPVVHVGPEWWFTTQPAMAVIQQDPVGRTVPLGAAQVQLSVSGINIETYQWYKDGAPLADDPTDTLYTGEDSATLTIYDVQIADEGIYYCVVDNSLQQPDTSAAAQLMTKRLIGWWKLDGDLIDSVSTLYPDAVVHDGVAADPNFVIGKDGSALQFTGSLDDVVDFPNSSDFFNSFVRGFTVSAWVNMPFKNGPWETFVSMEGIHEDTSRSGYLLSCTGTGSPVFTLRQSFNDMQTSPDLDNSGWHLMTATYDAEAKQGRLFIDGVLRSQATNQGVLTFSPADLVFGRQNAEATTVYDGLLDDVRIYSYPINAYEVAELYTSFTPGFEICVEYPGLDVAGPNGVGNEFRDCKVDLYDFAVFAQEWLECNVVPTCLP